LKKVLRQGLEASLAKGCICFSQIPKQSGVLQSLFSFFSKAKTPKKQFANNEIINTV
jgi:hypothetical protein